MSTRATTSVTTVGSLRPQVTASTSSARTGTAMVQDSSGWRVMVAMCPRSPPDDLRGVSPSAGAGELAVGRFAEHEDLGAVGAPGVPSAGGISLDAEAVVDLGVVAFAEQPGVLQAGLPAEDPLDDVVDLAPIAGGITAGEDAVAVSDLDGFAHGGWHEAGGAGHVGRLAVGAGTGRGECAARG